MNEILFAWLNTRINGLPMHKTEQRVFRFKTGDTRNVVEGMEALGYKEGQYFIFEDFRANDDRSIPVIQIGFVSSVGIEMALAEDRKRVRRGDYEPTYTREGDYHGDKCNRGACNNDASKWWNETMKAYYCQPCAFAINESTPGLCVKRG